MKCKIIVCIFVLLVVLAPHTQAFDYAQESSSEQLYDELDEQTADYLESAGINEAAYNGGGAGEIIDTVLDMAKQSAASPVRSGVMLTAVIILCALTECGAQGLGGKQISTAASCAASLAAGLIIISPVSLFIDSACTAIESGCGFTAIFAPVYAGIITASGQPMTAAGYSALTLGVCEVCVLAVMKLILPLSRIFLALALCSSAYPAMKADRLLELAEKGAKWVFGFFASLFSGTMSISAVSSGAADNAAAKALRFAVSGGIPVAGGAISDTLTAVQGSIGTLRASVGGFAIIACAFMILPRLLTSLAWGIVMSLCSICAQMLGCDALGRMLKAIGSVVGIITSLLVFVSCVLIISTALVVSAGK